jgi:hypothetical protein
MSVRYMINECLRKSIFIIFFFTIVDLTFKYSVIACYVATHRNIRGILCFCFSLFLHDGCWFTPPCFITNARRATDLLQAFSTSHVTCGLWTTADVNLLQIIISVPCFVQIDGLHIIPKLITYTLGIRPGPD